MLSILLTVSIVTMAPARLAAPDGGARPGVETARVVAVHDGDSIVVDRGGHSEKVRLVGIDAPELNDERESYQHAAEAALAFARSELKGKTVTLEVDPRQGDRDRYERLLRYVILVDGTNFNEELVRKGYARVYDRFAFDLKPQFKKAEAEAKHERLGIWKLPPGKPRQVPDERH